MIKAANILLCSLLLFAAAGASPALAAATDDAIKEAVRREANTILLRQKLPEAQSAQEKMLGGNARRLYGIEPELVVTHAPDEYKPQTMSRYA